MAYIIIIALLIAVIIAVEVIHFFDRKSLYRYIKSENLKDADRNKSPLSPVPSGHREAISKWRSGGGNK